MKRRFFSVLMTMFITIISLNGCNTNKEIKDDEQNQAKQVGIIFLVLKKMSTPV